MPWRILLCLSLSLVATAQPKLTVTSATSKQTILSWTSAEPGPLVVERKPQGAAKFDVITTIRDAGSAYTDATIDPMTIYQYRVRAEAPASKPSSEVTVGPPATGYSVALATPKAFIDKERPGNFAKSIAMQLDSNGDPAFIYSLIDPRFQDNNDAELWFLHWDRARWQWKPPVKVAGYTVYRDGVSLAGNGGSVWTTVTESERGIEMYLSTDDGMTWTRKHGLAKPDVTILGRAVALSADQVFWVYAVNSDGVYLLSGLTTDDPQKWKTEKLPFAEPVIFGAAAVDLSIAVDSQGRPGLTYFGYGPDYNATALYWRPGEPKSRKIQDSDGVQNDFHSARITYAGAPKDQAKFLVELNRRKDGNVEPQMWIVRETSPAQMAAPLLIPTDGGHHSLNGPVAVSFDAAGNGAALMGRSGGQGDDRCGAPKLARGPAALTASWKTCSPDTRKENDPVMNYGLGLHFAVNGKLYGGWSSPSGAFYGKGIILWREP